METFRLPVSITCILYGFATVIPFGVFSLSFLMVAVSTGAIMRMSIFIVAISAFISACVMVSGGIGILLDPPRGISLLSVASLVLTVEAILYFFVMVLTLYPPIAAILLLLLLATAGATPPILSHIWCNKTLKLA